MKISNEVLAVLAASTTDGNCLYLPPRQLERKLYEAVNKVLEANGGKWDRRAKAHVFDEDAGAAIEQAVLTGEFHRVKQDLGQFDTPPDVARRVIMRAAISPGMDVLEPSAGLGNLVHEALAAGAGFIRAVEMDPKRVDKLKERFAGEIVRVNKNDFLNVPTSHPVFDRVVMNPPFAKQADIDHVTHALKFLKPGGHLSAVMSASVTFRENSKTALFREMVSNRGGSIEKLPEGAFAQSGTNVNACLVTIGN